MLTFALCFLKVAHPLAPTTFQPRWDAVVCNVTQVDIAIAQVRKQVHKKNSVPEHTMFCKNSVFEGLMLFVASGTMKTEPGVQLITY